MPYVDSFINRDNSLYVLDDVEEPRSFDEFDFASLTDWSNTNSSVSIVLDNCAIRRGGDHIHVNWSLLPESPHSTHCLIKRFK